MSAICNWLAPMPDMPAWSQKPWLHAVILLLVSVLCYLPGLNSPFLFDDQPNLAALSQIQQAGITGAGFWEFVLSGNAGPTGRPVSLFTFALQATAWPDNPAAMKAINVLLHALNGLLLYAIFRRLAQCLNASAQQSALVALVAALAWVLHPVHTSTVLYTIQRMALLASFFMLAGILVFIECRIRQYTRSWPSLIIMALVLAGIGLCGLFSKENAAALVFMLLVLDYTLLREQPVTPAYRHWRLGCLWLPAIMLLTSPLFFLDYLQTSFADNRSFTLMERLLTQGRVLWHYLAVLLVPSTAGVGIFHDVALSRSLLDPATTLLALLAWGILFTGAIMRPDRRRLWPFALGWYLAAHMIESTVLPLELFFHHRSYLAIAGIFFALAYAFFIGLPHAMLRDKARPAVAGLYLVLLLVSTLRISLLWASPAQLAERWHEGEPNTMRNAEFYAIQLVQYGPQGELLAAGMLERAANNNADNLHVLLNLVTLACINPAVTPPSQNLLLTQAKNQPTHSRDPVTPMQQIIDLSLQGNCPAYERSFMTALLDALITGSTGHDRGMFQFELARVNLAEGHAASAIDLMEAAWDNARDTGILFNQAIVLINTGRNEEALAVIALAETEVRTNNNIRTGTREDKLASLGSMRADVLGFMASEF